MSTLNVQYIRPTATDAFAAASVARFVFAGS